MSGTEAFSTLTTNDLYYFGQTIMENKSQSSLRTLGLLDGESREAGGEGKSGTLCNPLPGLVRAIELR